MTVKNIKINEDNEGRRIDNFLISILSSVPRSKVYNIIRKGEVRVNSSRIKPSYKLKIGDQVRIPPNLNILDKNLKSIKPKEIIKHTQDILFENKDKYNLVGIVDIKNKGNYYKNIPYIGDDKKLEYLQRSGVKYAFPAIGFGMGINNSLRKKVFLKLKSIGFKIPNLISNQAIIKPGVKMGKGNLIQSGTIIDNKCILKNNISIGLNVTIGHNTEIYSNVTISGGVITNGGCKIYQDSFIGMGAVVYANIGKNCKISPNITILEDSNNNEMIFNGTKNKRFKTK